MNTGQEPAPDYFFGTIRFYKGPIIIGHAGESPRREMKIHIEIKQKNNSGNPTKFEWLFAPDSDGPRYRAPEKFKVIENNPKHTNHLDSNSISTRGDPTRMSNFFS